MTHKKLAHMQCYHIVTDTRHMHPTKNHDEPYSPRMVQAVKNYLQGLYRQYSRLGFKTCLSKTKTKTCKNGSRDVSRPRLKSRELPSLRYRHTPW